MENTTGTNTNMEASRGAQLAGFWRRGGAVLVDSIIIAMVRFPVSLLIMLPLGIALRAGGEGEAPLLLSIGVQVFDAIVGMAIIFFYSGWFYKNKGATPGKMLFKLKVVDAATGTHLNYGRTFLRETVGKFLSTLTLFIGFFMAAFRQDKRALHDLLANTQVLKQD